MTSFLTILMAAAMTKATVAENASAYVDTPDTVQLPDLVTVAPFKTRVELLPLDVNIVTEAQIANSTVTSLLPILVNQVPGLFVSERGYAGYGVSGGSAGEFNIRGVGQGNKVLFMIDGMPQWAGVFGHALPDTYVANGVERVEVVKGPSSLLYGSSAMGGSVNIITKREKSDGWYGRARAMFGSYSTQKFALATGFKHGKFSGTLAGTMDRSNGNRKNSEFWLANQMLQFQYAPTDNWQIGTMVDMTQTKANNPGTIQSPLLSMWTYMQRGTGSIYVQDRYDHVQGGVQAFINWGRHKVDDGYAPGGNPRDYLFNSLDINTGFTLFQTLNFWQAGYISLGLDFLHWGGRTWNTFKDGSGHRGNDFKESENEIAGYVMAQQGFGNDILNINAGIRLQHGSQYGNEWVPQAGFVLKPFAGGQLKFNWSKGFRAPNLRELYMYAAANPDLKPEKLWNYDVEFRQSLLGGRLNFGVSFFFIDGSDMIQTVRVDGRPHNENVGHFINKGFEIDAAWHINNDWRIGANYSYLHSDADIIAAPLNKLNAELEYSPRDFTFTLESNTVGGLYTGGPKHANYSLLNFKAAYDLHWKANATFFIKLDNLTDRHYEIIYGCPMPGFNILGGVELKF